MSHKQFNFGYKSAALCHLVSIPTEVGLLLAHKIRDTRFQRLAFKWACTLVAVLSVAICVFNLLATLVGLGSFAYGMCVAISVFWFGTGDILFGVCFGNEWFFELAIGFHALNIFEDRAVKTEAEGTHLAGEGLFCCRLFAKTGVTDNGSRKTVISRIGLSIKSYPGLHHGVYSVPAVGNEKKRKERVPMQTASHFGLMQKAQFCCAQNVRHRTVEEDRTQYPRTQTPPACSMDRRLMSDCINSGRCDVAGASRPKRFSRVGR